MGNRIVIRGEFHISNVDRRELLNRNLEEFDVLFMEGRSNFRSLKDSSVRYLLFLIGTLYFDVVYSISNLIFKKILPFWQYDIEREAQEEGLSIESNIDLELEEIYQSLSSRLINGSFSITIIAVLYAGYYPFKYEHFGIWSLQTPIPAWIFSLILISLSAMMYSGLLITGGTKGDRDEHMANSIAKIAEDAGYDNALVLVGDTHVEPVSKILEKKGWEVKRERSKHPIPRISRSVSN